MDLRYDLEQTMLRESIGRFLINEYATETRNRILSLPEGWSREIWGSLAEMGLLGMGFDSASGGHGEDPISVGIIAELFGRHLLVEPYIASVLFAGRAVALLGDAGQKDRYLAPMIEGQLILTLAHAEGSDAFAPDLQTRAQRASDGWLLSGRKTTVIAAESADWIVVTAVADDGGLAAFMVPAGTEGLTFSPLLTTDQLKAADLDLVNVRLPATARLGTAEDASPAIAETLDRATAILCADAIGSMEALLAMTTEYLQTRVQFGQPLAKFQVLQHRLAEMAVQIAEARAITTLALLECASGPQDRGVAVSAAKARVTRAGEFVARNAVQLHGGVGVTEDLSVSAHFRRLTAFSARSGTAADHLRRYEKLSAGTPYRERTLLRQEEMA